MSKLELYHIKIDELFASIGFFHLILSMFNGRGAGYSNKSLPLNYLSFKSLSTRHNCISGHGGKQCCQNGANLDYCVNMWTSSG